MYFESRRHFDACLRPIRSALYRIAVATVGGDKAADVLQDALMLAWMDIESASFQQLAQFRPETRRTSEGQLVGEGSDFFHYLIPFVRSACHSLLRKPSVTRQIVLPLETVLSLADQGAPPDVSGELWSERRLEIYRLLQRVSLTPRQEFCIRLWLHGYTQAGIADYLGIQQSTVCMHAQRGGAKLLQAYREQENRGIQALEILEEIARDGAASIYHKPQAVWDRKGHSWQIQQRRYRFDEHEENDDNAA